MPKYLTLKEACLKCRKEGKIIAASEVDIDKIRSTLEIAEGDIDSGKFLKVKLAKDSSRWNSVYKLYYDALHELVEAFLRFDNVKSDNHQCLFACLCDNHPELGFDWDFFEKIRTKRNGINYYGRPVTSDDFKDVEIQFELDIKKIIEEIKKKIDAYCK